MVIRALYKVFRNPAYVALSLFTGAVVFAFAVWLPNIRLIAAVLGSPEASFAQKLALPISLLGSIATNFTLLSASYTVAIAVLFGINLAMVAYFVRHRVAAARQSGIAVGFLGLGSGILGTGCAACGSFLLMNGLTFAGASGALVFLPLGGAEFGVLGTVLLAVSIYLTAKRIQNPAVCGVNR
ncbi:MAG: hypothetical protein AAB605_00035 [Patescibacteria group bacterium]